MFALIDLNDAWIFRCGDFCADDRQQTKPIALPLVHACGVIKISLLNTYLWGEWVVKRYRPTVYTAITINSQKANMSIFKCNCTKLSNP